MSTLLDVEDLRVTFPGSKNREVRAVDGLSYSVYAGQTLAIVGESGSGKTVGCRAVMGLLPPSATVTGSARFQGIQLIGLPEDRLREHRGANVAMVFQDPARSLNPTMRVGAQIAEAVRVHRDVSKAEARKQAVDLLRLVHIPLPGPSWGSMIAQGQGTLSASPELVLIPSAFLFVTVVALNVLGDALRERWAR